MEPKLAHLDCMQPDYREGRLGTANHGNAPASHDLNTSDSGSQSVQYSSFNKGYQVRNSENSFTI